MEIFKSADDMLYVLLRHLHQAGFKGPSAQGDMREVWGAAVGLSDPDRNFVMHPGRNLPPAYVCAELLWYLSDTSSIEMIQHYAPSYAQYTNDGETDPAAYGHRIHTGLKFTTDGVCCEDQLQVLIELLKKDPLSRQAVIVLWHPFDLIHARDKTQRLVPCTIALQFLVRNGQLHLNAFNRSSDVWLGLPCDVYTFTMIQRIVAQELDLALGSYAHFCGSLHLYEKWIPKAEELLRAGAYGISKVAQVNGQLFGSNDLRHGYSRPTSYKGLDGLSIALNFERQSRIDECLPSIRMLDNVSPVLAEAAIVCAYHNTKREILGFVSSPILKKAYDDYRRRIGQAREDHAVPPTLPAE